jgi:hypothetical protein
MDLGRLDELGLELPPPHIPRPHRRLRAGVWPRDGEQVRDGEKSLPQRNYLIFILHLSLFII